MSKIIISESASDNSFQNQLTKDIVIETDNVLICDDCQNETSVSSNDKGLILFSANKSQLTEFSILCPKCIHFYGKLNPMCTEERYTYIEKLNTENISNIIVEYNVDKFFNKIFTINDKINIKLVALFLSKRHGII